MSVQVGDWVRTETGEVGRVVDVYRLSAFVDLKADGNDQNIKSYLISKLTTIDPPVGTSELPSQMPRPACSRRRSSEPNGEASSKISH